MFRNFLLVLISIFLFTFSWPVKGFPFLIIGAFVPMFYIAEKESKIFKIFFYSVLIFIFWNLFTTYWIMHASLFGMLMAIFVNSILMSTVFTIFILVKRYLGNSRGWWSFVSLWLAFEYLHFNWDLAWPWLSLGNVFANTTSIIQWYEYTGVLGGSLWVLVLNIFTFKAIRKKSYYKLIFCLLIPIIISFLVKPTYKFNDYVKIVLVQPNIDPYKEKFTGLSSDEQIEKLLNQAEKEIDNNTDYLIGPETALVDPVWENNFEDSPSIIKLNEFLNKFPNLKIILGASTYKMLEESEELSNTSRHIKSIDKYYEAYNSAFQIDTSGIQIYHKSKLVPGVEMIPFSSVLKSIKFLSINLGGVSGSLGSQNNRTVFQSEKAKVAPIICYESIFGEYVLDYVRNGANLLTIITNDGWWKDTPGYKQHLSYASLRAIETRRNIARSANTGTTAFIDIYGNIINPTSFWEEAVIKLDVPLSSYKSFYLVYGNYIGRISSFIAAILILFLFSSIIMKRKKIG